MNFETIVREKIKVAPFKSREKEILKVVLGEVQLKAAGGKVSDETCYSIVEKLVSDNTSKVLPHLSESDSRRAQLLEENRVLSELLPKYLTAEEIKQELESIGLVEQIKTAKNVGASIGIAMGHLRKANLVIKGDVVKKVVSELRGEC